MQIETLPFPGGRILRLNAPIDFSTDLGDLKRTIEACISGRIFHVAVSLPLGSRLCSMSIGMLLQYHADLAEQGGTLTLIQPDAADADLLEVLTITRVIEICSSEEEFLRTRSPASRHS